MNDKIVNKFEQIEQEIYAPNEFGWEKFYQCYCAYFAGVDFTEATWPMHEKVTHAIELLFDKGIRQYGKQKNTLMTLDSLKEAVITDIQKFLLSLYSQSSFDEEEFFKYELFLTLDSYCSEDEKFKDVPQDKEIILPFLLGIFMQLKRIKENNLLGKEHFIEKQMNNFKAYIEPGAFKLVCYLLSQNNVNTHESHACSLYHEDGSPEYEQPDVRKSLGTNLPNGVWFMVMPSNRKFGIESCKTAQPSLLEDGTRFYFAKLHRNQKEKVFFPQNGTFLLSFAFEHLPLKHNIYENEISEFDIQAKRIPSKRIQYNKPAIGDLGFTHIQEMQIAPLNRDTPLPELNEAIRIATEAVKAEKLLIVNNFTESNLITSM